MTTFDEPLTPLRDTERRTEDRRTDDTTRALEAQETFEASMVVKKYIYDEIGGCPMKSRAADGADADPRRPVVVRLCTAPLIVF